MNKLISFLALSFCALTVNAQATHNMRVTFNNGKYVVFGMDSVKTVEFEEKMEEEAKATYTINGVDYPMPEAIDLGLPSGTKWASMNIGARSIEDSGGYYCWADPTGALTYYDYEYDSEDGPWNSPLFGGINPPDDIGGTTHDIATVNLGRQWRIPSLTDFMELDKYCTYSIDGDFLVATGPNGSRIYFSQCGVGATTGDESFYEYIPPTDYGYHFQTSTLYKHKTQKSYNYPGYCNVIGGLTGFTRTDNINFDESDETLVYDVYARNWMAAIRPIKR